DKHKSSLRKKFIKNKFNGNLIIDWTEGELRPGKLLSDIIKAYKEYVEKENATFFNYHIKETPAKQVREDFLKWYNEEIKALDKEFNSIPI
ncbi:MAG TPA: hypothetical protein VK982_03340, partial [Bacteroidales bacterium]|nr:hypothetical protein [Bacteroidales bacterium]